MEKIEHIKRLLIENENTEAISYVITELKNILVSVSNSGYTKQEEDKEFLRLLLHFEADMYFDDEIVFENRDIFRNFEDVIRELLWILNDTHSPTPISLKDVSKKVQQIDIFEFEGI